MRPATKNSKKDEASSDDPTVHLETINEDELPEVTGTRNFKTGRGLEPFASLGISFDPDMLANLEEFHSSPGIIPNDSPRGYNLTAHPRSPDSITGSTRRNSASSNTHAQHARQNERNATTYINGNTSRDSTSGRQIPIPAQYCQETQTREPTRRATQATKLTRLRQLQQRHGRNNSNIPR